MLPLPTTTAARPVGARAGLSVARRTTVAGPFRHAPSSDHHLTLHAGAPVRISCTTGQRCVRSAGEINVLPAGTEEAWTEDDATEILEVRLPASLVRLAADELGLDPARAGIVPRCHVRDARVEHIAWALAADDVEPSPSGLVYRECLGMALAVHLLSHHAAPPPPRGLDRRALDRLRDYVESHLAEDVSLARLARVAGVSVSHLGTLFKRTTGVSVHAFVVQRRVERARALLVAGASSPSQVALDAGFSHQSHMARCMRRVLGVTPASIVRSRASA